MCSGIYKIYCIANNKQYIGSAKDIHKRWIHHKWALRVGKHSNAYLQSTYNKYGIDTFVYTILEECSVDMLLEREQFYLNQIFESGNTFNLALVAGRPLKNRTRPHTEETKKKISESNKGRKPAKDTLKKLSDSHKGKTFTHSEETKRKIGESNKNKERKPISEATRKRMSVARKRYLRKEKQLKANRKEGS